MTSEAVDQCPGTERRRVLVRFLDDELLEGDVCGLDLDEPDFELALSDHGANATTALVPLAAVKCITLERHHGVHGGIDGMRKVAVRFRDGEVLKGLVRRPPERARHGVALELFHPADGELEELRIPHHSLKAIFFLKAWDARPSEYGPAPGHWEGRRADVPLVELLGEIGRLSVLRDRGEIDDGEFRLRRRSVIDRM